VCGHHARGEGCGGEKDAALRPSGRSLGPGRGGAGRVGVAVRLCGPTMVPDLGSQLASGGRPACFSPLSRNDRMPLGCPAVPGAEFSVAGFASGAFAMQPRNGPIPVLDGPQRARARAASDAGGLENSDWIHAQGWVRWGRSAGVSAVVALMVFQHRTPGVSACTAIVGEWGRRQDPDKLGSLSVSVVIPVPSGMSIRARVLKQSLPMHRSHGRF
jgi:hypothetical protein